jgi:hypothetical protein
VSESDYYIGGEATVAVVWTDPTLNSAPVDPVTGETIVNPTTVTAVARRADGSEVALVVQQNVATMIVNKTSYAAGQVYYARVDFDRSPGLWVVAFTAAGSYRGYKPRDLYVKPAPT